MNIKPPKHVNTFTDRHGRVRSYLRLPGQKPVPLPGLLHSPEMMTAIAAVMAGRAVPVSCAVGAARTRAGTLNEAIVAFYASNAFTGLGKQSQARHRQVLEKFRQEISADNIPRGDRQLATLTSEALARMLEEIESPHAQRHLMNAMRALMRFAKATGRIDSNPTAEVKAKRAPPGGFKAWDESHVAQFRAFHPLGTMQRLAFEIMLNTGLRRCDAVRLGRQHLKAGRHVITPSKTAKTTGMVVKIAVHRDLQAALDAMPSLTVKPGSTTPLTYLTNTQGKAFTVSHFGQWFAGACTAAGLPDVRAHGLRKCIAIRLVHQGMKPYAIAAIIGDTDLKVVQTYTAQFDREVEADKAMAALDARQVVA